MQEIKFKKMLIFRIFREMLLDLGLEFLGEWQSLKFSQNPIHQSKKKEAM